MCCTALQASLTSSVFLDMAACTKGGMQHLVRHLAARLCGYDGGCSRQEIAKDPFCQLVALQVRCRPATQGVTPTSLTGLPPDQRDCSA